MCVRVGGSLRLLETGKYKRGGINVVMSVEVFLLCGRCFAEIINSRKKEHSTEVQRKFRDVRLFKVHVATPNA